MRIDRPPGFLSLFRPREPVRLPDPRDVRERERAERVLAEAVDRLRAAASELEAQAPEAKIAIQLDSQIVDDTRSVVVGTVEQEVETTTPATPARQYSTAFGSASSEVALLGSVLELQLGNGDSVRISVDTVSASLTDLEQLLNDDSENAGRLAASIVEDADGFRLQIETVATGAGESITVVEDDFTDPSLASFALIDTDLAEAGADEFTTSETVEVPVTETQGTRTRVEQEIEVPVPDEALEAALEGFVASYNELRAAVEATADVEGLTLELARAERAVGEIAAAFDAGGADAGVALDATGAASLDSEALQRSVERDVGALDERLRDAKSGLTATATRVLEPAEEAVAAPGATGLLARLTDDPDRAPDSDRRFGGLRDRER